MLDPWERWVQYHELQIKSSPEEAPYIPFTDMVPHIVKRVNDGEAVKIVENDTAALRISKAKHYREEQVLILLVQYANKNVTDPSFQKLETGELRTEPKLEGEGVAVSAHVAISLVPNDDIGITHRLLLEEITGLGRSRVGPFFHSEFKASCDGLFDFLDRTDNGRRKNYHPDSEILGTPSKDLLSEIEEGVVLQGIELVKLTPEDKDFDEEGFYTETSRHIKIVPERDSPAIEIINRIRGKARELGYDDLKIRYKRQKGKQKTSTLGATKGDLADALIIRDELIRSDEILGQCMEDISASVASKMVELIVAER